MRNRFFIVFIFLLLRFPDVIACSVLYYIDTKTGKIFAVNNEDFWYDIKPYIKIIPADKKSLARLWYGWDNFAQGGVNQSGLFFDGASTPEEKLADGYSKPKDNLGDGILAACKTVNEALDFLEKKKIALTTGHLLFGDSTGNAAVVEWVNGERKVTLITDNKLMMTNFLLDDTAKGNYPCPRYNAMEFAIANLRQSNDSITLKDIGNVAAKAVQPGTKNAEGKEGGTLYSTFVDITDMKFVLIYKLDNSKMTKLDLKSEFASGKKRTIKLE